MPSWRLFALAAVALVMVPFSTQLLKLRLRFLKWIHWSWAADLLEKYFDRWIAVLRTILIIVAAVFAYFGWANLET